LTVISERAQALRQLEASSPVDLGTPLYWWAHALEEVDDRARFLFAFAAMEVLINTMAKIARARVAKTLIEQAKAMGQSLPEELIHEDNRSRLTVRFAFLAYLLEPACAAEDALIFQDLKDFRDRTSHGSARLDERPPCTTLERLGRRYFALTIAYLAGTPPAAPQQA
jgi:hypothetical protein